MLGAGAFLREEVAGLSPRPRVQPATSASEPRIGSRDLDGHVVVRAAGEIGGSSAPRLRDELVAAIDRRSAPLVVDLSDATFADGTGLDVLVGALRAADIIGGDVRLAGAGPRLRALLAQAGLEPVFVDAPLPDAGPEGATRPASPGPPGDDEHRHADGAAAMAEAAAEAVALRAEIDRLRQSMQRHAVIEQAKGVLMLRYGVDADRAFAQLREWSQRSNTPLHRIADTLVTAICRGARTADHDTELVRWLELRLRRGPDEYPGGGGGDAEATRTEP